MPQQPYGVFLKFGDFPILFCEIFDVWGIDFMGPLPSLIVSRWVEAKVTKTNDARTIVDFVKSNIFCRFGVSKVLISDQGSHFYNRAMAIYLKNIEWCTESPLHITLKPVAKMKSLIGKSRSYYRRWKIQAKTTRATFWRMQSGRIEQLIRLH
ncbi:hypothetical protein CR513_05573, partial [Mucuna pruriens]